MFTWTSCPPERDPGESYTGGLRCLIGGQVREWGGPALEVVSPVFVPDAEGTPVQRRLGSVAQLDGATALEALGAATTAYGKGRGEWPTMSVAARIGCMEDFLGRMEKRRTAVSQLICWEVAKSWADSTAEFDRTVAYGRDTIAALKELDRRSSGFVQDGGFFAQIRRSPLGVNLCLGPYNYPLNETYATLLPALIMGNPVVMKPPRAGILCHQPLLEDFAAAFPPGVVNVINGDGATVIGPLMESGQVDVLAFIGGAKTANILKKQHPTPNRMRSVLGLGAKNLALVLPDAPLDETVKECVSGALSFNGQRCTALKMFFVHRSIAGAFAEKFAELVNRLPAGPPFADKVQLTPLPDFGHVQKMTHLLEDAVAKGARVMNPGGGETERTYFHPAVLFPITAEMELWRKEQFGPLVPIAVYDDASEVLDYLAESAHGQQAAVFTHNEEAAGPLIDALVNQVCRVNLNSQCRRGPDSFPFGGRKDSAEGTLSIGDALRVFSIRTLVAAKNAPENTALVRKILQANTSQFLSTDYLF